MRRWLAQVVRDAMGARIGDDEETEAQYLDRWADEMAGEALIGETILALRNQQKNGG